jgi:hypothetical protein
MKIKFFVFVIPALLTFVMISGSAAHAQVGSSISSQPNFTEFSEHVEHATPHAMATENSLVGGIANAYSYAQGERPLWEFGPVSQAKPLGDVTREVRAQKLTARKAEIIFEQEGSKDKGKDEPKIR